MQTIQCRFSVTGLTVKFILNLLLRLSVQFQDAVAVQVVRAVRVVPAAVAVAAEVLIKKSLKAAKIPGNSSRNSPVFFSLFFYLHSVL